MKQITVLYYQSTQVFSNWVYDLELKLGIHLYRVGTITSDRNINNFFVKTLLNYTFFKRS